MLTRILGDRPFLGVAKLLGLFLLVGLALTAAAPASKELTSGIKHRSAALAFGALEPRTPHRVSD
jgi:hypothetical protein